jgi:hypothetical protein
MDMDMDITDNFKKKAKELGVVLSGVNLDKDEDDLFKLFKVERDFALKTQLRDLVQREKQQQQQQPAFKSPRLDRVNKRPKSESSSGSRLDEAEPEQVVDVAAAIFEEELSTMQLPGSPFAKPSLGAFTKIDLPLSQGEDIDMRFSNGDTLPVTPVGARLREHLSKKAPNNVILRGKSGCGKTSAIFDAAQQHYCLLFTACSDKDEDNYASLGDPGGYDASFARIVLDVREIINNPNLLDEQKQELSSHRMQALIVARMLVLQRFLKLKGATPTTWLLYQLTQDMHKKTRLVYARLAKRQSSVLSNLRDKLGSSMDFFFAFDEAQFGYDLLKENQQIWYSTKDKNEIRGIACPFVRSLTDRPVVIAGTALSLGSAKSCKSDLGKNCLTEMFDEFPSLSVEEIKDKLRAILDLTSVNLDEVKFLWRLEGRGRLFGGLFQQLAKNLKINSSASKKETLQDAIIDHYNSMLKGLETRIEKKFTVPQDPLLPQETPLHESFHRLAIFSLLGGTVSISAGFDIDLLHVGLCSVRRVAGARDGVKESFILDEELGRQAILNVAIRRRSILKSFAGVCDLCKPASDHAMEPLLVAELRDWSEKNPSATVKEFLSQLFDELPEDMPDWIENAIFEVRGGFNKENCLAKRIPGDIEFVEEAIKNEAYHCYLLSPSTVKRPDFEAVMGQTTNLWFLCASSKLYSSTYNDNSGNDFRSTMPSMFYMKKDGTKNNKCCKLRLRWEKTLQGNPSLFKRCLRIHFCLPEVNPIDGACERLWVAEDGSIVVYITSKNIRKLFRKETVKMLSELGYLGSHKQATDYIKVKVDGLKIENRCY